MTENHLHRIEHSVYHREHGRSYAVGQDPRVSIVDRIATIERAVNALASGVLETSGRHAAQRAAHKLAVITANLGYWDEAELAREAEAAFEGDVAISPTVCARLSAIVSQLTSSFLTER